MTFETILLSYRNYIAHGGFFFQTKSKLKSTYNIDNSVRSTTSIYRYASHEKFVMCFFRKKKKKIKFNLTLRFYLFQIVIMICG